VKIRRRKLTHRRLPISRVFSLIVSNIHVMMIKEPTCHVLNINVRNDSTEVDTGALGHGNWLD